MDQQLLDRFFRGSCSAEEQQQVLAWYLSGEAEPELAKKIEAYWWTLEKPPHSAWGKEEVFASIKQEINSKTSFQ